MVEMDETEAIFTQPGTKIQRITRCRKAELIASNNLNRQVRQDRQARQKSACCFWATLPFLAVLFVLSGALILARLAFRPTRKFFYFFAGR
jgi:hypothetical protein